MADPRTIEVGNASILLTGPCDPFRDGHTTGYLEFYDERGTCHLFRFLAKPSVTI